MHGDMEAREIAEMFQSAPGREAGRCPGCSRRRQNAMLFQSAPGREAGRCSAVRNAATSTKSFNPRPAVRPGDASHIPLLGGESVVSIRARP